MLSDAGYDGFVRTVEGHVVNGRLVVEEPTQLPEGTVVKLVVVDEGDDLDDDERTALHAAIEESWASLRAGEGVPADDVLGELDDLG